VADFINFMESQKYIFSQPVLNPDYALGNRCALAPNKDHGFRAQHSL